MSGYEKQMGGVPRPPHRVLTQWKDIEALGQYKEDLCTSRATVVKLEADLRTSRAVIARLEEEKARRSTVPVAAPSAVAAPPMGSPPNMADLLRRVGDAPMVVFPPMTSSQGYHLGTCIQQMWDAWLRMEGVNPQN
jgi:hypothetical protein